MVLFAAASLFCGVVLQILLQISRAFVSPIVTKRYISFSKRERVTKLGLELRLLSRDSCDLASAFYLYSKSRYTRH